MHTDDAEDVQHVERSGLSFKLLEGTEGTRGMDHQEAAREMSRWAWTTMAVVVGMGMGSGRRHG